MILAARERKPVITLADLRGELAGRGIGVSAMTAPMVLDGPLTADWFLAETEQVLVPPRHRTLS